MATSFQQLTCCDLKGSSCRLSFQYFWEKKLRVLCRHVLLPYMGPTEFGGQGQWLKVLFKDESYEMALLHWKFLKTNTSAFKAF